MITDGQSKAYVAVAKGEALPDAKLDGEAYMLERLDRPLDRVIGCNLLWNSDFSQGPKGWDLAVKGEYFVGLDLNERWKLDDGHTLFIRSKPSDAIGAARYVGPAGDPMIPVIGNSQLKFSMLFGLLRADAFVEISFFDRNKALLETVKEEIDRGSKIGGQSRDSFEKFNWQVDVPKSACFASLVFGLERANIYANEDVSASDVALFVSEPQLVITAPDVQHIGLAAYDDAAYPVIRAIADQKDIYQSSCGADVNTGGAIVAVCPCAPQLNGLVLHSNDNLVAYRFKPKAVDKGKHIIRAYIDEHLIGVATVKTDGTENWRDAMFVVPDDLMDGRPHGIDVVDALGRSLAREARVLQMFQTDWFDILRHTTPPHEGKLAPTAQMRYQALERAMARLAMSDNPARDAAELTHCHHVLVRGWAYVSEADYKPIHFPQFDDKAPEVSIVIPVHNKPHVTYSCLASLKLAVCDASFEIIVVDDGSDEATQEMLAQIEGIKVVRHNKAKGFNGAANAGAKEAIGQYIVFLNNDTEPASHWLDELIWPFCNMDNVGMTGAKLIYPNGRLQEAGGMVNADGQPYLYGRLRNSGDPRYNYTRDVDYVSGAALMISRDLWRKVDGFSAYLAPAYWEDADLAFKARKAGKRVVYAPKALVIHHEGLSHGRDVEAEGTFKRYQKINEPKFKKKWKQALKQQHVANASLDLVKDRGVEKRVLFLDNEVPRPDFDAGSYAAIQEIRMFQQLGYKVTFLPANRAYLGHYTEDLERMGVEVLYSPFAKTIRSVLQQRGTEFDAIFVTRYYVAQHFVADMRTYAPQAKILFNNADCHFLREMRAAMIKDDTKEREAALKAARKVREDELAVMRSVDLNFSYNDTEKEILNTHLMGEVPVVKLPWVQEVVRSTPEFNARDGIMFLGGYGHTPNTEAAHFLAEEIMPRLKETNPEIILYLYGSRTLGDVKALETDNIRVMGQIPDVADAYNRHRLFVASLLSGAGIKGKVLGALSHGLPCVLSPIAAEGIVGQNTPVPIANSVEEYCSHIVDLYHNQQIWGQSQKFSQDLVEQDFGLSVCCERLEANMKAVL